MNVGKRGAAGSSRPLGSSQREYDGDDMDDTFDTFDGVIQVGRWDRDNTSGYAPLKYEELRMAQLQGLDVPRSRYWSDLWTCVIEYSTKNIIAQVALPVARSAGGFLRPGKSFHLSLKIGREYY